jgi:hypothetical protein
MVSEDFLNLNQDALFTILQNDDIRLKTEAEVFHCCINWAKHQHLNESREGDMLRDIMGKCLFQIRFITMSSKEFAECVGRSSVLSSEEKVVIFCHIATGKEKENLQKMGFNVSHRNKRLNDFPMWLRFHDCGRDDVRWHYEGELDAIAFKTDQDVIVHGVCVYGGYFKGDTHTAEIKVYDAVLEKWVAHKCKDLVSDGTDSLISVFFDEPVKLQEHFWHAVALKMCGPDTFFGEMGSDHDTVDGVYIEFSDHVDDVNGTDVYNGQIPMIILTKAT